MSAQLVHASRAHALTLLYMIEDFTKFARWLFWRQIQKHSQQQRRLGFVSLISAKSALAATVKVIEVDEDEGGGKSDRVRTNWIQKNGSNLLRAIDRIDLAAERRNG